MINPKKLVRMTRKWQNLAALRCTRITFPRATNCGGGGGGATIVDKGCFVVYSADEIRFVIPLDYLKNYIFQEILEMAEEEYGSQGHGPIKLPFKATFTQYAVSLIERQMGKDLEDELHMTITSWRCFSISNLRLQQVHPQLLVG